MEEKRIKSPLAYYTVGLVWLGVGLVLPMYSVLSWVVAMIASVVVFVLVYKKFPDKVVMVQAKTKATGVEQADTYIKKAMDDLQKITYLNMNSTAIGAQVGQITDTLGKIIAFIQKYPQKARTLNSFMDYYLPTTIKLIESYQHLLFQGQTSENISTAKQKIEQTMPTLVKVFANQLDALFEDKAMDISAEIKVLKDFLGDI